MNFRRLLIPIQVTCIGVLLIFHAYGQEGKKPNREFSIGVIADCQYCDVEGTSVRKYSISNTKLEKCVADFNTMNLVYTIHLGDFIDRDFESFDIVNSIYNKLNMPKYHVLGNHDFSVIDEKKADVREKMGMPANYYDFKVKGWRFVVLDGNDISFHSCPKDSEDYKIAEAYYEQNMIKSPRWNGAIGATQLEWLKAVLNKASINGEKAVLYCHFPIYPENVHNLWNANEIIEIIEAYSCVKAYINGHNHEGNYGQKDGIHYLTMKGMVDSDKNSYAIIEVHDDHLKVIGYGREENRILENR